MKQSHPLVLKNMRQEWCKNLEILKRGIKIIPLLNF